MVPYQVISSAAMTMFALLVAYLGYTSFKSPDPWRFLDLFIQIVPATFAGIFLALVPWLATKRREADLVGISVDSARKIIRHGYRTGSDCDSGASHFGLCPTSLYLSFREG